LAPRIKKSQLHTTSSKCIYSAFGKSLCTSTVTSMLTTKSTYRSQSKQRLSERPVLPRAVSPVQEFNPLKTKRRQLYLKPQSVPRCKHFSSRL